MAGHASTAMRPRSFSWSGFRSDEDRDSSFWDPFLAQEDEETRNKISRYLHLADQLLFTDEEEAASPKDDNDAA